MWWPRTPQNNFSSFLIFYLPKYKVDSCPGQAISNVAWADIIDSGIERHNLFFFLYPYATLVIVI